MTSGVKLAGPTWDLGYQMIKLHLSFSFWLRSFWGIMCSFVWLMGIIINILWKGNAFIRKEISITFHLLKNMFSWQKFIARERFGKLDSFLEDVHSNCYNVWANIFLANMKDFLFELISLHKLIDHRKLHTMIQEVTYRKLYILQDIKTNNH